jgi:hypothetical protein
MLRSPVRIEGTRRLRAETLQSFGLPQPVAS